jgi:hypothetical protein
MSDWLDLTRYPNLDPDDAVPGATLSELREVLLGHEISPLPPGAWHAALSAATGPAGESGHLAGEAPGAEWDRPGDGHLGPAWLEHQPDGLADHHAPSDHDGMPDPNWPGGHW